MVVNLFFFMRVINNLLITFLISSQLEIYFKLHKCCIIMLQMYQINKKVIEYIAFSYFRVQNV